MNLQARGASPRTHELISWRKLLSLQGRESSRHPAASGPVGAQRTAPNVYGVGELTLQRHWRM